MVKKCFNHSTVPSRRKLPETVSPIVLGVTGGIACGKSLVCQFFKELGAAVLSADELAREAVRPGEKAYNEIVAYFGKEILTTEGSIDRARLAEKVFRVPAARHELNQVTHPAIGRLAEQRISELRKDPAVPLIIYEAPLLFEAKAEGRVDLVLVVAASPEQQLERLIRRENLSREEAYRRISAQMPLAEKVARADILIENNGSPAEVQKLIGDIFVKLTTPNKKNPPIPEDV
ncbi:MAG: dephospho-CoA kinase [Deltaproteobacteria bacterium HGW-Deltaproteobacteria-4]|nr:MAG: dephospho-CoA kinase [Deltaproteobacteria bacterium HGW-Deltaproteobacteria-4]